MTDKSMQGGEEKRQRKGRNTTKNEKELRKQLKLLEK